MRKLTRFLLSLSAVALAIPGLATVAQAQGADDDEALEEIIVSGLRGKPRSAVDSAVPIDTFDATAIQAVSHADTVDILQTLVPSYNVGRQPISDGSSFIRPANLRGLPTHHTLVLINGKRRHRSTLVTIGGDGDQGPDVATIPSVAIKSIEVLRDGASSQYGSDAIAGVINFNLKDNREGITITGDTGTYYESDGDNYNLSGNIGLPLGEDGFFSISAEYNKADPTQRAFQYCESWFCLTPSNPLFQQNPAERQGYITNTPTLGSTFPGAAAYVAGLQQAFPTGAPNASVTTDSTVVQPWGVPNLEAARAFYNAGYELDNGMELYSFGNYSTSNSDGSFFYRYPGNGTIETLREADGSFYNPLEIFPGGFTPQFKGVVTDYSSAIGVRGAMDNGFAYDVSARYGKNEIEYTLFNTINPSLGPDTPTRFKPGKLSNEELQFQVDLSNEFDIGGSSPLVFAYGGSWMREEYDVQQSNDVDSFAAGPHALQDPFGFCTNEADITMRTPTTVAGTGDFTQSRGGTMAVAGNTIANLDCTDSNDPVYQVVGVGSNGFPGYSPDFSENFDRHSYALYADLSMDVNDRLFLQAAGRFEDYSDFGSELVGKLAGRFRLNDTFAIRGSIGTGFRAPTPGQQGTTNVSTRLPNGLPVATGLFPASGPVAQALGATPLDAETSTSYTLGLTASIESLILTVDVYRIDIDDRFSAISTLDVSSDPNGDPDAFANFQALEAAGVPGANTIGGVFYFTNAFDSRTEGIDIVASYPVEWDNGQTTDVKFAYNFNKSQLESDASAFLNDEDQFDFENSDPNVRWNITATHTAGDFSLMARGRYFGESENGNTSPTPLFIQRFGSTFFVDMEASYQINDNWQISLGGRNIFDEFPDQTSKTLSNNDQCCGRKYVSGSIVPWQGGYYYGRFTASF